MNIFEALSAVMADVGAVRKDSKNTSQNFNFRGIDAVVNAVSPALRKHGVVVFPDVLWIDYQTVTIGSKGTQMGHCKVKVRYTFAAKDGSKIEAAVFAEAMDSGDKATAKAMSVAFRTCLLQTLCLPTDEIDPDAESYERTPKVVSSHPRAVDPAGPIKRPSSLVEATVLTKAQKVWIEKRCFTRGGGDTLTEVSKILGRTISDLNDVTAEDKAVLLPALSDGD